MDGRPLQFGVIGAGAIGLEHIRNLEIVSGAQLAAVADADENSLSNARDLLENTMGIMGVSYTADYVELLRLPSVDAIIIVRDILAV